MVVIVLGLYFWAISPYSNLYPPPHINVVIVLDLLLRFYCFKICHDRKIRVCMQKFKIKQIARPKHKTKLHENDNTSSTSIPRVSPTCCLKNMAMVCMLSILAKQIKTKDHSPTMTLSWLPIQKWSSPSKKTC